jgi:hypothetical protein
VTDNRLADLYVHQRMSVVECAERLGVSTEHLRKQLAQAGLAKRPGTFAPYTGWRPDDLRDRAAAGAVDEGGRRAAGRQCFVASAQLLLQDQHWLVDTFTTTHIPCTF